MNRPRLLVLASTYPRWAGDPEPGFVHELARRLTSQFDVAVLCPHAPGAAVTERLQGVQVHRYRYAPAALETLVNDGGIVGNLRHARWKWLLVPGFFLAQAWAFVRLLRTWRPDAVHAHWLLPQGVIAALVGRTPCLVTCHGADLYALRSAPLRALKRFAARRATALTVVSQAMLEDLRELDVPPGRAAVEPMGVDLTERFVPDPGVARAGANLLFVGRLVEKKGLRCLIDALPAVVAAHPGAQLTVAGFGPEEERCRRRVAELGLDRRVQFLGPVPQEQLPALYRAATLLVAPFLEDAGGDREGLGLVVVEAQGCECPVLVSDLPATRDTVEHGVSGWRVPPGSVADLAAGICHLLERPPLRRDLAVRGRESALRFDWARAAEAYARRLLQLSAARTRR